LAIGVADAHEIDFRQEASSGECDENFAVSALPAEKCNTRKKLK